MNWWLKEGKAFCNESCLKGLIWVKFHLLGRMRQESNFLLKNTLSWGSESFPTQGILGGRQVRNWGTNGSKMGKKPITYHIPVAFRHVQWELSKKTNIYWFIAFLQSVHLWTYQRQVKVQDQSRLKTDTAQKYAFCPAQNEWINRQSVWKKLILGPKTKETFLNS